VHLRLAGAALWHKTLACPQGSAFEIQCSLMPSAVFMKALLAQASKRPQHMQALSLTDEMHAQYLPAAAWAACNFKGLESRSGLVGKEPSGDLLVVNMMGAQPFETCSTACSGHWS